MAETQDVWGTVQEQVDRIVPIEGGVTCFITNFEFVPAEGNSPSKTQYLVVQKKGEDGVHREISQNILDPFSGKPELAGQNIATLLMLFGALIPNSDTEKLKASLITELGSTFTHEQLHNALVAKLDPNYQTVEVEYMFIYPIKNNQISKYVGRPTVGNFIKSKYRKKDFTPFNPTYMSWTMGVDSGKTPDGPSNLPKRTEDDF